MTSTLPQSQPTTAAEPPAADAAAQPTTRAAVRPRLPYPVRIVLVGAVMVLNMLVSPLIVGIPLQLFIDAVPVRVEVSVTLGLVARMAPAFGAVGLVWLLMKYVDRRRFGEAGLVFTRASLPWGLVGVLAGLVAIVPAAWLLQDAGLLRPDDTAIQSISPLWTFATAMVLGLFTQGFPEEFLWRGYALQTMRYRPLTAVLVSGLVFGAMHIVSVGGQQNIAENLLYLAGPTGFGLLAGVLAVGARSIWPAVGVHFGVHLAYYLCAVFGLGTGPALWLAEGAAFLAIAAIGYFALRGSFQVPIKLVR